MAEYLTDDDIALPAEYLSDDDIDTGQDIVRTFDQADQAQGRRSHPISTMQPGSVPQDKTGTLEAMSRSGLHNVPLGATLNAGILTLAGRGRGVDSRLAGEMPPASSDDPGIVERFARNRDSERRLNDIGEREHPIATALSATAAGLGSLTVPAATAGKAIGTALETATPVASIFANKGAQALAVEGGIAGAGLSRARVIDEQGDLTADELPSLGYDTLAGVVGGPVAGTAGAKAPKRTAAALAGLGVHQAVTADNTHDRVAGALMPVVLGGTALSGGVRAAAGWLDDKIVQKRSPTPRDRPFPSKPSIADTATRQIDEDIAHGVNTALDDQFSTAQQKIRDEASAAKASRNLDGEIQEGAFQQNIQQERDRTRKAAQDARKGERDTGRERAEEDLGLTGRKIDIREGKTSADDAWREVMSENDGIKLRKKFADLNDQKYKELLDLKAKAEDEIGKLERKKAGDFGKKSGEAYRALTDWFVQNGHSMEQDLPDLGPNAERVKSMFAANAPEKLDPWGRVDSEWDPKIAKARVAATDASAAIDGYKAPDIDAQVSAVQAPEKLLLAPDQIKAILARRNVRVSPEWLKDPTTEKWTDTSSLDQIALQREKAGITEARAQKDFDHQDGVDVRREQARIDLRNAGLDPTRKTLGREAEALEKALGAQAKTLPDEGIVPFDRQGRAMEIAKGFEGQRDRALEQAGSGRAGWTPILAAPITGTVGRLARSPVTEEKTLRGLLRTLPNKAGFPEFSDPHAAIEINKKLETLFRAVPKLAEKHLPRLNAGLSAVEFLMYLDRNPDLAQALEPSP